MRIKLAILLTCLGCSGLTGCNEEAQKPLDQGVVQETVIEQTAAQTPKK